MSEELVEPYIPWVRDALLPGESTYALLNKLGWFAGRGPLQLMRDLRITDKNQYPVKPDRIDYANVVNEWSSKSHRYLWPINHGRLGEYFSESNFLTLKDYPTGAWEEKHLRFCTECVAFGMHFTVCQLRFVEFCPYHKRRLLSNCSTCGEQMNYTATVSSPAFGCDGCGRSLLAADMTDICANRGIRWKISRTYQELLAAMVSCTPIHYMVTGSLGRQGKFPGIKEATTAILEPNERRSKEHSFLPSFAAIKVISNQRGLPSIHRVSRTTRSEDPCSIDIKSRAVIHQSAQLRAGALDRPEFHRHSVAALRVALFELYR